VNSGRIFCHVVAGRSAAVSRTAGLGACAGVEPADGDDLIQGPDSDGEGAGAAA
jgi:hypothetical protein